LKAIVAAAVLAAGLMSSGAALAAANGQQVYSDNCVACHQAAGEGRPPVFPSLKGDAVVKGPKAALIATVVNGRNAMPAWGGVLNNDQVAAVLTYVRGAWGNKAPAVTTAEVAAVKAGKPVR
jgi:cytochrome c oxidase subunit 2